KEILDPSLVSLSYHVFRDVVTAALHSLGDTLHSDLNVRQPVKEEQEFVARTLPPPNPSRVRLSGQRRLESEVRSAARQLLEALQVQPARLDRHAFGLELGESARDRIRIHILPDAEHLAQERFRDRGLPRPIRSRDRDNVRQVQTS